MTHKPEVSVIMTVYNGEQYLAKAIDSILAQSFKDFEFIIVNDGSSDGTATLLDAYNDSRIKVIHQQRSGRAKSLNRAIFSTRAEYIANIDADDISLPTRLERQLAYMKTNPQIGLLGTAVLKIDAVGKALDVFVPPSEDRELRWALAMRNPFVHSSVMMRRSAIREVGLYDESLPCVVDRDLWVRIAQRFQLAVLSEVLVLKRLHPQQYFRGQLDEAIRLQTSGAIRMKAARELSLPYHVRLLCLLYTGYARLPGKIRTQLERGAIGRMWREMT
jgi:glycosyltransferase involved in cell wall biosynthesis